ncbi:MAG: hypothetical protein LDL44_12285 [Caenispirillum sp.]|nr:hypothetical protein [Caenispirillum sp.]
MQPLLILYAAALAGLIGFIGGSLWPWTDLRSDGAAAWLQAVGGLGALTAAGAIAWLEHRRAVEARRETVRSHAAVVARRIETLRKRMDVWQLMVALGSPAVAVEVYQWALDALETLEALFDRAARIPGGPEAVGLAELAVKRVLGPAQLDLEAAAREGLTTEAVRQVVLTDALDVFRRASASLNDALQQVRRHA